MNVDILKYFVLLSCAYSLGLVTMYAYHFTSVVKKIHFTKSALASTSRSLFNSTSRPTFLTFNERVDNIIRQHINKRNVANLNISLQKAGFTSDRTVIFYNKPVSLKNFNKTTISFPRRFSRKNKPKKTIGFYDTCAILGSAGILRGSRCGKEIDAHDFVLRSNMAPTIGFEDDVGVKTNLTTLNFEKSKILAKCLTQSKYKCGKVADDLMKEFDGAIIWFSKYGVVKTESYVAFTESVVNRRLTTNISYPGFAMPRRVGRFWNISSASSGLVLYTIAAAFCNKVSMYGFFPFYEKDDGTPVPHHYYENVTFNYTKRHSMPDEFKLFLRLNQTGHVRLVTDQCLQDD